MKKFLSFLVLCIFLFNSLWAYAADTWFATDSKSENIKNAFVFKSKLSNSVKWKKFIKIIDAFILQNEDNKAKLKEINDKIEPIIAKNSIKNQETLSILKYMNARINVALIKIAELEANDVFKDDISENDKKIIEDKIVKLQLNTLDNTYNLVEKLTKKFEKENNYQEKWNFEIDVNLDKDDIWKFKTNLKLDDYTANVSNFDYQLKWQLSALVDAIPKWDDKVKVQLSSFIDFISKDGNIYLLLKDLKITNDTQNKEIESFVSKIKELAINNKYIKIEDENTKRSLSIIKSINPKLVNDDLNLKFRKPLVTAYKKEDNKYYLKPTKYACDLVKQLNHKFDPLNPTYCTDKQYNDLLKELNNTWVFYAEFLNDNDIKISFSWNNLSSNDLLKNEWYIVFNDSKVLELKYDIDWWQNGVLNLYFKDKNALNFKFLADSIIDVNLKSNLDENNRFSKLDFSLNDTWYYSNNSVTLKLDNHLISWSVKFESSDYNYDTRKYEISNVISWQITWKTSSSNTISELNVKYSWKDKLDVNYKLNWEFDYKNKQFSFINTASNEYSKSNFSISWEFDNDNILNSWNIKLTVDEKKWSFDYDNYKYVYSGDFEKVIDMNINVNNKIISWYTKFYTTFSKELLSIKHSWEYSKNKFKLNNDFSMMNIFEWYTSDARNSKRISDIWNIQSAMSLKSVEWIPLSSFVVQDNKYAWKEVYVWWNKLVIWKDYFVWTPNYSVLNIIKEDFLDPVDNSEYVIWVSTKGGWVFQVFGKKENSNWTFAIVNWTYTKRIKKDYNITRIDDYTVVLNDKDANSIKIWDITNLWKITKVSRDWVTLILDTKISSTQKTISLTRDDSDSLIYLDWKAVTNYEKLDSKEYKIVEDKINWNLNLEIDKSSNNNIFILIFKVIIWDKEIFNWSIKNIWTKEFKTMDIPTPTNVIDYKEIK